MAGPQDDKNTGVVPPNPLSGGVVNPALIKSDFQVQQPEFSQARTQSQLPGGKLPPDIQQMISKGNQAGDALKSSITDASEYGRNQFYYSTPRSVNADQFERYYSHPAYDRLGYSPWRDNEQIYNDNSSGWADFRRAAGQWASLAGIGFKSGMRSWGDLLQGKPFREDVESAREFQRVMEVGSSSRGGVSGFMTNTFLNSGYTFGVMGEMLAEEAALALVTAGTAGGAAGETAPLMGTRFINAMGKVGRSFDLIKDLSKSFSAMKDINFAKTVWNTAKKVGGILNPLENTTKLLLKSKNLEGLAKNTALFGAFYRDVREINFALSESKLEGGSAYLDQSQRLTDEFYKKTGRMPVGKELDQIKENAKSAAAATTIINLPVIYYTNKLTFDGLFKGFRPLEKSTAEFMTKAGSKVVFDPSALAKGLNPFRYVEANFKNAMKSLLRPQTYFKAGISYFKGNLSEGLQESLQDVISGAAKDYYASVYNNRGKQGMDDVMGAITSNMAAQFSKQGLETFLGGFVMGALIKPVDGLPGWTTAGYYKYFKPEKYKQYQEARRNYTTQLVNNLNELYKDPLRYFGSGLINIGAQSEINDKLNAAEASGNTRAWHDLKDSSMYEHIWTALDTETYDIFLERLNSISNMDPKSIQEAFGAEDGSQVLANMNSVITRANSIKKNYEFWKQKAPNPFDARKFKKGTQEYIDEAISQRAWDLSQKHAVFMNYSFQRTLERMNSIATAAASSQLFEKVNSNDISILFNEESLASEISLLHNEVASMSQSSDPQMLRNADAKRKKLSLLLEYTGKLRTYREDLAMGQAVQDVLRQTNATPEDVEAGRVAAEEAKLDNISKLKEAYRNYVKGLAAAKSSSVINQHIDSTFDGILDFYSLNQDSANLSEAVNLLADPEGFTEHFRRTTEILRNLYNNREAQVKKGIEETISRKETNSLLNQLYEKNVVMDIEELERFLKDGTLPEYFYDFVNKIAIGQDHPRYAELAKVLLQHEEAAGKEEAPAPEPEAAPEEPEAEGSEPVDEKQVSVVTPWEELPQSLRAKLEPLWEEFRKENHPDVEGAELERYRQNWLRSTKPFDLITEYNIANKLKAKKKPAVSNKVPVLRTKKIADGRTLDQLSISELNSVLKQLRDIASLPVQEGTVDTSADERKLDIQDLEDYIAARRSMSPQNKSTKVMEIVDRIEQMQQAVTGRSEDNSVYMINGEPYQRVTTVVAPVEAAYNGTDPNFTYFKMEQVMEVFQMNQMNGGGLAQFMERFRKRKFSEFNERKYQALEKALSESFDMETLRTAVNDLAYDESRSVGNTLDGLIRNFFQDKSVDKPESMSQEAYDHLMERLNEIRDNILDKNLTVLSNNIVVYDPELKIAGEIDILAIDNEGEVYIYDIKSSKKANWDKYQDLTSFKSNKIKHQLQLSAYGNLLLNSYGIDPKGYAVIPLEVTYDLDGNIKTLKARDTIRLEYLPDVEEVIPRNAPAVTEVQAVDETTPAAETESSTESATEIPDVPLKMSDLIDKPIIWQGKSGRLALADDGTYVLDTGKVLYDITREADAVPESLGVTLPQVQDKVLNKAIGVRTIYRAKFTNDRKSEAEIAGVKYRVNRDSLDNIVSLTYNTNQREIAEAEQSVSEMSAELATRKENQRETLKNLSAKERNDFLRETYALEEKIKAAERNIQKLKKSQQSRTTSDQDLLFSLKTLPDSFPARTNPAMEKEDIKIIKSVSDSSTDIEFADRILSEDYPDQLEILIDQGPQALTTFDLYKIQLWGEQCLNAMEAENISRKSTQLERTINQLYDLLNDLENIKLTKDGRISKRQGGKTREVQKRENPPAATVSKAGPAAQSTQQNAGEIGEIKVPLVFRYQNNNDLVAAGLKTATSRTRNTTGLKKGESGLQTIYAKNSAGLVEAYQIKVTYHGLLGVNQANEALKEAAERAYAKDASTGSETNFETAEAFKVTTTGRPQDETGIKTFLSGKAKRHIYSLEVLTPEVKLVDTVKDGKVGEPELDEMIKKAENIEQLDKVLGDIRKLYGSKLVDVPASFVRQAIAKKRKQLLKDIAPSKLKNGDVLIGNNRELYKVVKVGAESTIFEKLTAPGSEVKIPTKEIALKFQGRWVKDMETVNKPEPTSEEKTLMEESGDNATAFLSDKTRIQKIADEAEKGLDRDSSLDKLLGNLDC